MPSFLIVVPLLALGIIIAWVAFSRPYLGLLLTLAINPLDFMITLPDWLSLGRLVASLAVLGWLAQIERRKGIANHLKKLHTFRIGWPFIAIIALGVLFNGFYWGGISRVITISILWMLSMLVEDLVHDKEKTRQLLLVWVISSAFLALLPVGEYFGIHLPGAQNLHSIGEGNMQRSAGITANPNGLALIMNIAIFWMILFLYQSRSILKTLLWSCLVGICIMAIVLSSSRTHYVALIAFFLILLLASLMGPAKGLIKTVAGAIVFVLLLSLAISYAPEYSRNRLLFKKYGRRSAIERVNFATSQRAMSLEFIYENPLFGIGLGSFSNHATWGKWYLDAHDSFSVLVGETGGLGVISFLWILWFSIHRVFREFWRSSRAKNMNSYYYSLVLFSIFGSMILAGFGGYVIMYQRLFWVVVGLSVRVEGAAAPLTIPVERTSRPTAGTRMVPAALRRTL